MRQDRVDNVSLLICGQLCVKSSKDWSAVQDLLRSLVMTLAVSAIRTKVTTTEVTPGVQISREETLVLFIRKVALIVIAISA
jgi:hypothetical protein